MLCIFIIQLQYPLNIVFIECIEPSRCNFLILLFCCHMRALKNGFLLTITILCCTCHHPGTGVDLIVHNGVIYTVDSAFTVVQAMAVNNGTIVATGTDEEILSAYSAKKTIDLRQRPVFP